MNGSPNVVPFPAAGVRVLHVLTTLLPGGTERLVLTLCRALLAEGCRSEVAVLTGAAPLAGTFEAAGFPVHRLGMRSKLDPRALFRLRRLARSGSFDVLNTHLDLADLYGPFAAPRGTPVISTRHNTDSWRTRRTWKRWPFLLWERAAHRRAASTIAVSAAVRDFLVREEGLDAGRFVVVPNGIDLAPFAAPPSRAAARRRLAALLGERGEPALAAEGPVIGFVGRLAPQKGVDILLEAVARATSCLQVVLVGSGPLAGELRRQAATGPLARRVRFAGATDGVAALLPALDLFVFPSRWEGFGLAAVEAMAAGVPVLASDADGLREVVEDGVTGRLVRSGDAAALARALDEMLARPAVLTEMGAAARRRAFERFSAERMAREVAEVYRRALGRVAPDPAVARGDGPAPRRELRP